MSLRIAFCASSAPIAQSALAGLTRRYGDHAEEGADAIVALGGDGFMLQTLHRTQDLCVPVYGMNRGTVGFLMNEYREDGLIERLEEAVQEIINPLSMTAMDRRGAELLFQVLTEREEKISIAIASNESFSGWTKTFTDPRLCAAIVDWLTFNGTIIETGTDSYRLAHGLARTGL